MDKTAYFYVMNEMKSNIVPKISIILPVYNAGEYLRPCLDTLINQTLQEIEIVCILDCPTDGSDKIVEEYAEKDSRILVIKNDRNLHIGESRNVGIWAAHGDYIGFSDHDDIHEPDMYEKLYAASENGRADVVLSGKFVMETGINADSHLLIETCLRNILNRTSTAHITPHIFKKALIEKHKIQLIDTKKYPGEDVIFFTEVLCQLNDDNQIAIVPEVFYHHIETGHNTADSADYALLHKIPLLVHHVYRLIDQSPYNGKMNKEMWTFLILTTYTSFMNFAHNKGLIPALKEQKSIVSKDRIYYAIANNCSGTGKKISIAKKIFAFWLKRSLKMN